MALQLADIFSKYRVDCKIGGTHHHVRSGWLGVDCPRCSPNSGRYRLGFEVASRRANCWVCGRVDAVEMLALVCKISTAEAGRLWSQRGLKIQERTYRDEGRLVIPDGVDSLQEPHRRYLGSRGFDPDQIAKLWGVQGIGVAARLSWRLYIPIFDKFGRQISWTTRSLAPDADKRYISASPEEEIISHKSVIYGAHLCRSIIVFTEGPADAWAIGPGAGATCGLGCTAEQIAALAEFPVRIACFDNEYDAQRRAGEVCEMLSIFPGETRNIVLETGKDPASAEPAEVAGLREHFFGKST